MNNPFSNNDTGLIKLPETKKELFRDISKDENWSCDMLPLPLRLLRLADQNHYLNTLWNYLKYSHSPLCSRISRLEITDDQERLGLPSLPKSIPNQLRSNDAYKSLDSDRSSCPKRIKDCEKHLSAHWK